ncbi:NB-ARC domain-containing protein [Lyngbya sp. CCY1209]|uniref:NB-ARC domain-containing protein n=1 Tax=Lyngbya sp. CCY1209 TaxID=2886103 RepID=UPI002D208DF1|nr:NB-ARC domain-containing protein [Lyngbya sp. CCY1209]MEB3886535.1 NACHT domain-containing protein [Lyngbya sp. CCY1209]
MDIAELLQFVDRLVEKQTGEHLDDLQKSIAQGLCEGKSYKDIAEDIGNGYNENYIGDVSRQLFKILSKSLNEDIKKSNFCWTLERAINSQIFSFNNNNLTWCPYYPRGNPGRQEEAIAPSETTRTRTQYHDLTLAPKVRKFCDRTTELDTLSRWLIDEKIPLISVIGTAGIGKTTLVKKLIDRHLDDFDVVIWKNLKISPQLNKIVADTLTKIVPDAHREDDQINDLMALLSEKRCLIVIDDLQEIFVGGQFAGRYQTRHKNYHQFLRAIAQIEHQSSIILIGREQSPEMLSSSGNDLYPIKSLAVGGLESVEILENLGLTDRDNWADLIQLYEGNPVYLQDISALITNIFLGKVSEFLAEDGMIITELMHGQLRESFEGLSSVEQAIALELSKSNHPISRSQLRTQLSLSSTDLINGLQSLQRRCLLKAIKQDQAFFQISSIFREYLITIKNGNFGDLN